MGGALTSCRSSGSFSMVVLLVRNLIRCEYTLAGSKTAKKFDFLNKITVAMEVFTKIVSSSSSKSSGDRQLAPDCWQDRLNQAKRLARRRCLGIWLNHYRHHDFIS